MRVLNSNRACVARRRRRRGCGEWLTVGEYTQQENLRLNCFHGSLNTPGELLSRVHMLLALISRKFNFGVMTYQEHALRVCGVWEGRVHGGSGHLHSEQLSV